MGGNVGNKPGEAYLAMLAALADGEWHDGQQVRRLMERAVPPGVASRHRRNELAPDMPIDDRVEQGRRGIAQRTFVGAIERGQVEIQGGGKLTRAHWTGVSGFMVRATAPGEMGIGDAAASIDVGPGVLRGWAMNGFVPSNRNAAGVLRFTPAHMEVARRVREIYEPGAKRWKVDPRTLWDSGQEVGSSSPGPACPHCGEAIKVVLEKEKG